MFEGLAEAVEELEIPIDPAALAQVLRLQDRLTAKVTMAPASWRWLEALRELVDADPSAGAGSSSCWSRRPPG